MRTLTILLTGFGPFPGAPFNPTGELVRRLAARRWSADIRVVTHIFETSYKAVNRDLPKLIKQHRPDVLLMFGLAARSSHIRIETRARNALSAYRDATKAAPRSRSIVRNAPDRRLPFRPSSVVSVLQNSRVPVRLSRDAGAYLCNYLCWQAAASARLKNGPHLAAFMHVPKLAMPFERPRRHIGMNAAVCVASRILRILAAEARRP